MAQPSGIVGGGTNGTTGWALLGRGEEVAVSHPPRNESNGFRGVGVCFERRKKKQKDR